MSDLFDYMFFYLASLFLAVLKVAGFITWDWWVTALPGGFGLSMAFISAIASR